MTLPSRHVPTSPFTSMCTFSGTFRQRSSQPPTQPSGSEAQPGSRVGGGEHGRCRRLWAGTATGIVPQTRRETPHPAPKTNFPPLKRVFRRLGGAVARWREHVSAYSFSRDYP